MNKKRSWMILGMAAIVVMIGGWFMLALLQASGVDFVSRLHQLRTADFERGRRLGKGDHVAWWPKPERPDWMDEETYAQIPDELRVRELRVKVEQPGFRVNELVLVTTLLDAEADTKEEVAHLFLQRWNIELDLRSIKDVLRMDVLRCKTPEMVRKEMGEPFAAVALPVENVEEPAPQFVEL